MAVRPCYETLELFEVKMLTCRLSQGVCPEPDLHLLTQSQTSTSSPRARSPPPHPEPDLHLLTQSQTSTSLPRARPPPPHPEPDLHLLSEVLQHRSVLWCRSRKSSQVCFNASLLHSSAIMWFNVSSLWVGECFLCSVRQNPLLSHSTDWTLLVLALLSVPLPAYECVHLVHWEAIPDQRITEE